LLRLRADEHADLHVNHEDTMLGMFEGNTDTTNALDLLKNDHDEVEKMFDEFEERRESSNARSKRQLVERICKALEVHAQLEEEVFYPAFRKEEKMEDLLDEAAVEHQSVKTLVARLEASTPDDTLYDARVKVLSEYVKHHVREEEGEMFPKARSSGVDLDALGQTMAARKEQLEQGGAKSALEEQLKDAKAERGRRTTAKRRPAGKTASTSRKTSRSQPRASQRKMATRKPATRKTSSKGSTRRSSAR
jgi:hemerythrin superfamily protein